MSAAVTRTSPVLDPHVVRDLGEELGDERAATCIVARFLSLLPSRTQRLERSVTARDPVSALDAVLSLKVSAAMVGGRRLQEQAQRLERLVRAGQWPEAGLALTAVHDEVGPLTAQLQALVGRQDATAAVRPARSR